MGKLMERMLRLSPYCTLDDMGYSVFRGILVRSSSHPRA